MKDGQYSMLIAARPPSKSLERLLGNLNGMGSFYEAYPEEEAICSLVEHLRAHMAPSVRRQIVDHLHQGGAGMKVIVRLAVGRLTDPASEQNH